MTRLDDDGLRCFAVFFETMTDLPDVNYTVRRSRGRITIRIERDGRIPVVGIGNDFKAALEAVTEAMAAAEGGAYG